MKERLRYWQTWGFARERCLSLGSWCPLKKAYCDKHLLYPVHRRGPHKMIKTFLVLVHEMVAHREIALKYKDAGALIVGFDHGLGDGRLLNSMRDNLFDYLDCYVISDDRQHFWGQSLNVPIETVHINYYTSIQSPPGDTVMLIGFPFTRDERRIEWLPSLNNYRQQQDLHQGIIDCLEKMGIKWVYKVHPDRIPETFEYLQIPKNRIETRSFEKTHRKASVIIQTSDFSTTFGYTLYLDKPMIYFRNPGDPHADGVGEWLKNYKVYELPWKFDEHNFKQMLIYLLGGKDEIATRHHR